LNQRTTREVPKTQVLDPSSTASGAGDIRSLLVWIKKNLLKERPELFIQGDSVVSWTTSFRTKTASSSSPRCTAAKGPSPCLGPLGVGRTEESDNPLGPYFQIFLSPLAAFFPTLSLELPPGREKRPGAKNEPFSGT
uniref:Ubiquitin-related modifier 1 n=1 Tax=Moschus moschiferus TaxID=68415 RepID=A0A8C6FV64_MOSMO